MAVATGLPRWDMDVIFPGLSSKEFESAFRGFIQTIDELEALFDREGIEKGRVNSEPVRAFETVTHAYNEAMDQARLLNSYVSAHTTTDSRNALAQARASEMDSQLSRMRKLGKRATGWMGELDVDALVEQSGIARDHRYVLEKAVVGAQKLMSSAEESLASDLELTGKNAWSKLHSNVTSQLTTKVNLPMSATRGLAHDADREVRRSAYDAELEAWKGVEVTLAAAMNSIKGEVLATCERRGWEDPLDEALYNANIDRETLDAMLQAAGESFPDFRRYLNAKARALGLAKLEWYDMFAPLGAEGQSWDYERACSFVAEQFGSYSPKMRAYAERNFRENWIDVPPAPGKVDGAYCMGVRGDESRILLNYKPSFSWVSTLAHELGHGYHNLCLANRTWLQRGTPMTLAETASIFCETIIRQAVLDNGTPEEQLPVLEASLQGSTQVVVDITSRFLFEQGVFSRRRKREMSPQEMCELMLDSQRQTYGDGLSDDLHPYMWAVKSHYYGGRSYYNFPYMFGLLFGLGLYTVYKKEPLGFQERYDDLLASTGMADAATLGQRFGIDIRSVEFWRGSLSQIKGDIDRFESLI